MLIVTYRPKDTICCKISETNSKQSSCNRKNKKILKVDNTPGTYTPTQRWNEELNNWEWVIENLGMGTRGCSALEYTHHPHPEW